ncbi:hypothetical protein [Helcococcus bovis]|uniref:Ig-like domain-containing protein n=1 Tax=Helcococcus bovis TaxID=3153252 RepID=A0ABW9F7R7_9FIRM
MRFSKRAISLSIFFMIFMIFPISIVTANSTYKVNEEISFGRTYEFEEPVNGSIVISGAAEDVITIGNQEKKVFENNISIVSKFTPDKIGIYKLNIEVNVVSTKGQDLSKNDTVYFVVTNDGKDMTDEEIDSFISNNSLNNQELAKEYTNIPYLKSIKIKNGKLLEPVTKDRTEYNIEVFDNSQRIEFDLETGDEKTKVDGNLVVNPNNQSINIIVVYNNTTNSLYTFKWKKPKVSIFKFRDENGLNKELVYDYVNRKEYKNLNSKDIELKGKKFKVFEDEIGNLLIPLREKNSSGLPDLYKFTGDGKIVQKLNNFISINSQTFRQGNFKRIFNEDQVLFNLEEVEIKDLNYAKGYKINRTGYENQYLVNLTDPNGKSSWYQYDATPSIKQLIKLDFPENVFEDTLARFFGIKLNNNYSKYSYSFYDIGLMAIAFVAFVVLIIGNILLNRKNKK